MASDVRVEFRDCNENVALAAEPEHIWFQKEILAEGRFGFCMLISRDQAKRLAASLNELFANEP